MLSGLLTELKQLMSSYADNNKKESLQVVIRGKGLCEINQSVLVVTAAAQILHHHETL